MKTLPFEDRHSIKVRALLLGQRIDLRAFDYAHRLAPSPLLVTAGAGGAAVLFRYGAVVLFGLSSVEEVAFLENLRPLIVEPFAKAESEEAFRWHRGPVHCVIIASFVYLDVRCLLTSVAETTPTRDVFRLVLSCQRDYLFIIRGRERSTADGLVTFFVEAIGVLNV